VATSRSWRQQTVDGPFRARIEDIDELNHVFSDSFTERYRRDGMVGVRVPFLNSTIWRYAIEDADDGAMLWRDDRGRIAAFNMVHRSGKEGWMGPLAVRTELRRELLRTWIGFSHNPLPALLFKGRRGGHVGSLLVVGPKS